VLAIRLEETVKPLMTERINLSAFVNVRISRDMRDATCTGCVSSIILTCFSRGDTTCIAMRREEIDRVPCSTAEKKLLCCPLLYCIGRSWRQLFIGSNRQASDRLVALSFETTTATCETVFNPAKLWTQACGAVCRLVLALAL
jgi:hypothetical protein